MDADVWPLFGLRIGAGDLTLRVPADGDLPGLIALARDGIHDPAEMPFSIPWTDLPSPEFERSFVQYYWHTRAGWRLDDWAMPLLVSVDGEPAGVQDLRAVDFPTLHGVETGSWLSARFQRRGIGTRMREAILAFAFDHLGAQLAQSAAFTDNPASQRVSEKLGYAENGWKLVVRRGAPARQIRYAMTRDAWEARQRPHIDVSGLDECRSMFGICAA
jgi:RimJ/RimL family protein N-acetyltransferase